MIKNSRRNSSTYVKLISFMGIMIALQFVTEYSLSLTIADRYRISFTFLLLAHIIDWRAPVAMVGTVAICSLIAGENVAMSLMTGGLMFGATFMVTDYATAPITKKGRLVFGFGCGLITFLIRRFGGYPEGVMFSILIMNSVAPFLNNLTARKYGYGKKSGRPADAAVKEAK